MLDLPPDEAEEALLDAIALAELDSGLGVPHERVREWLAMLSRGEKAPPPTV